MSIDQQAHRSNEILYWKNKFKAMEKENFKQKELLNSTVRQLEKEIKQSARLREKIDAISGHYTRIPPSSFLPQLETKQPRNRSRTLPFYDKIEQSAPEVGHRRTRTDFSVKHASDLVASTKPHDENAIMPYTIEAEIQDVDAIIQKLSSDARGLVGDEQEIDQAAIDEKLRMAKVQVEYDVWVTGKSEVDV